MKQKLDQIYEIVVLKKVIREAITMAEDIYPREMFAILGGYNQKNQLVIDKLYFQPFVSDESAAISHPSWLANTSSFRGTIHSHPGADSSASEQDLITFAELPFNLIMGHPYQEDNISAYDQEGNKIGFKIKDEVQKPESKGIVKEMIKMVVGAFLFLVAISFGSFLLWAVVETFLLT